MEAKVAPRENSPDEEFPPLEANVGWIFPVVHKNKDGDEMVFWLQMIAHSRITEKLKCRITIRREDRTEPAASVSFDAPVFPIDWSRNKIMEDKDCSRIGIGELFERLSEDGPYSNPLDSYYFEFTFKIVEKDG